MKGRVANDEVDIGHKVFPIDAQSICLLNGNVFSERQLFKLATDNPRGLSEHLNFGNPQRKFGDGNGEVVNLDAVKLSRRNFDGFGGNVDVETAQFGKHFVFKATQ